MLCVVMHASFPGLQQRSRSEPRKNKLSKLLRMKLPSSRTTHNFARAGLGTICSKKIGQALAHVMENCSILVGQTGFAHADAAAASITQPSLLSKRGARVSTFDAVSLPLNLFLHTQHVFPSKGSRTCDNGSHKIGTKAEYSL
mmetsp:Transcript_12885/g.25186  ORF Transcript_12885/g.25186 Transcript_12885/m.25186 type:complete len:143 (-) Transcript_12885:1219-1647(-)